MRGRNIFERKPRQGFQERPKTTARVYRNPSDGHRPPMPPRTDGCGFLTLSVRGAVTQVTPPPGSVSVSGNATMRPLARGSAFSRYFSSRVASAQFVRRLFKRTFSGG